MKQLLFTTVLFAVTIQGSPAKAAYWFENTFRRSAWVKETCAKTWTGEISGEEANHRLNLPKGDNWRALFKLCKSHAIDL
jgi:hypothetical protein